MNFPFLLTWSLLWYGMLDSSAFQCHCRTIRTFYYPEPSPCPTLHIPGSLRPPLYHSSFESCCFPHPPLPGCWRRPINNSCNLWVQQDGRSYWRSLLSALGAEVVDRCLEDFLSLDQRFICSQLFKTQTVGWQEWNMLRTGTSKQKYIFKNTSVKKKKKKKGVHAVYSKIYLNSCDFLLLTPWTPAWHAILLYL